MQPTNHNREPLGPIDFALYLILAADLCALVYTLISFITPLVLALTVVPVLPSVLAVVWLVEKIDNDQQEIATLLSRVDTTETKTAVVAEELIAIKDKLATTEQQRNDAKAKLKTATKTASKRNKDLNDLTVANTALDKLNTDSHDKISKAETSLYKEEAKHKAAKGLLHGAEQKIAVLTDDLADATTKCDFMSGEVEEMASENHVLAQLVAALEKQRDATEDKLTAKGAELDIQKDETAVLAERLELTIKPHIIAETKLGEQKVENRDLSQRLAACNAELDAASKELVAKDAMIAALRSKGAQETLVIMDQGKVNTMLRLNLARSIAQLQDFRFHSELQLRSHFIAKATVVRLQNEVKSLRNAMVSLQLPALTPSHEAVHDAAAAAAATASTKRDAPGASPNDSSTSTVSTTLSPGGSPGVSRTTSNMSNVSTDTSPGVSRTTSNMSNVSTDTSPSDSGNAQPVVAAPAIPALPSPSKAGAAPAVIHTGPHNRPKRVKRQKSGQKHDGVTRSSAKATKKKREGLFRGFSGEQGG